MDLLYKKTFRLLKPYWGRLIFASLSAMMFSLMSGAFIWMIGPLLGTIFNVSTPMTAVPAMAPSTAQVQVVTPGASDQTFLDKLMATPDKIKVWIKRQVDDLIVRPSKSTTLLRICWVAIVIAFLKNLFLYIQGFFMAFVQQSFIRDIRNRLFEQYQKLSLAYFHQNRTGQLISRVTNDVVVLNETIDIGFNHLISDTLEVIIFSAFLIILSWKLTLLAALILPVMFLFIYKVGQKLKKYSYRSQERMADVNSVLEETVGNIRIVKAFAADRFEINKFFAATSRYFKALLKMTRVRMLATPINDMLATAAGVFILWYAGTGILSEESSLKAEDFILFVFSMFSMIKPVKSLSNIHIKLQEGLAAAGRIFEVMETPPKVLEPEHPVPVPEFSRAIRYNDIVFAYDTGERVIDHISFEVKKGQIVALVGPSGAGKSTLFDLLPRFYDPQEGNIEIDGIDIRTVATKDLRAQMGIVTQETYLFNDTIRKNIAYGMDDVGDDAIANAARMANAHDFIMQFPDGYGTTVGNRGSLLSGGQRQRLAIARALLKNPQILIFDEATSALDTESEIQVQEAINHLMKGRTTLVIAHRLSTITSADLILVIEAGKIVQRGSHQSLLEEGGLYARLYHMQFKNQNGLHDV
ncbi:MAG: ABC transporter ATP-binding protein [candidate division Zixibacteria bacterium]|nr:ABC transporter ATP-binding protein [candidate division Zixibacteria bacterium]